MSLARGAVIGAFFTFLVGMISTTQVIAACSSTTSNATAINITYGSSAALSSTGNGNCLENTITGTITVTGNGEGISNNYAIDSFINDGQVTTRNTAISNGGTIDVLTMSGTITTSNQSSAGIKNTGTIASLNQSGNISAGGSGGTVRGILNLGGSSNATISNLYNTGTITSVNSGGNSYGIENNNSTSIIQTLTNFGTITGGTSGISNQGTITTLNNSQGASSALTYTGNLPTNYNIIINSPTSYGKLAVTSLSGSTTFGIYSGSTVSNGTYASVLDGVTSSNLTRTSGTFGSWSWILNNSSVNIWDLLVSSYTAPGPTAADTQSSMQYQASQLRSAFNTQTVAANFALNYDCNIFDVKGMCISAGGRYTTVDNPGINNSAAVVTLGYKVNPNIRIGAYLDQNINISNPTGVNISNNTPLMGLYAVWNKELSGLGYRVRLANTYQDKDVTSTRTVFGSSEAGSGTSSLKSQSYLAELSYAFQYEDRTLVRPYAGLRYTHLKQDGYAEATTDTVTDPLTVAALRDKSATALLGVKVHRNLNDKATLTAQLGLEQDLYHRVDNYSATDLNGSDLTAVAFNSNIKRTRPVVSAGAYYDVTKTQRASATINYQQTAFQSTGSATAYFNYMIGF